MRRLLVAGSLLVLTQPTYYHDLQAMDRCGETIIFNLSLYNPVNTSKPLFTVRTCASASSLNADNADSKSGLDIVESLSSVRLSTDGIETRRDTDNMISALESLASYIKGSNQSEPTILFSKKADAVAGVYAGAQVERISAAKATQNLISYLGNIDADSVPQRIFVQLCPETNATMFPLSKRFFGHGTTPAACWIAASGDGCWSLAQKCGITQATLQSYNRADLCSSSSPVQPGDPVCCSAGTLPDFSPSPNPDGSCATYTIKPGDLCDTIASSHYMTVDKIKEVNKNTWGWAGCGYLMVGQKICISTGLRPFPPPIANAVCGPQVPGTSRPTNGTLWQDLNPCPLNACCNVWGQCGITPDFCVWNLADTGNPGTAKPGTNGCISHCTTAITNNGPSPAKFVNIGYFESWNFDRSCLNMDISKMDSQSYDIVHFAFAGITGDYQVDVRKVQAQFEGLLKLSTVKRVVSFGGWSFSTDYDTFPIFRLGVSPANREAFAQTVVKFAVDYNLDGLDFDWEYPGAPDIPDIPAGDAGDGGRYLTFLKRVRELLPAGKTLSIAAPASYWYLKGFPIKEISDVVDYIDFNNTWANPGCPTGNCLRSHVNKTETQYALSMITKAGVPAAKVIPGLAAYGRSFRMNEVGCTGPECTFSSPKSGASPGPCTNTSGYISNYEIQQLIKEGDNSGTVTRYEDEGDILHFGGRVVWAADLYMDYADNGTGLPYDETEALSNPICDLSLSSDSLESLQAAASQYSYDCNALYAVNALWTMLDKAYANYTDVNNGYSDKFDAYKPCDEFTWDDLHLGSYHITLTLRDAEGFNKSILDKAGIDPSWINFDGKWYDFQGCVTGLCPPDAGSRTWFNYPAEADGITVPNPKDLVTDGLNNIMDTRIKIAATWSDMVIGYWNDSYVDVAQVLSVPVFMLKQAVDAMAQVKDIEAGALAAGATTLARVAAIAGETANTAFSIYTIVEDPDSALLTLMGMLVGAGGVTAAFRDAASFTKMAKVRKSMTAGETAEFRDLFEKNDDLL
ncbi:hypothetical protein BJX96DRAFT_186568 [Aspergillus floccosus]